VEAGETVQLTRQGAAVAHLRPVAPSVASNERLIGFARGIVRRVSDDFTKPLPDDTWTGGNP
jgi:antitoxin (DNA-binding transcriptional repressor) of toxin-antitoxin stability system